MDSVGDGAIVKDKCENLVIAWGVFIHWEAEDSNKIYDFNYQATKEAIAVVRKGVDANSIAAISRHRFAEGRRLSFNLRDSKDQARRPSSIVD